MNRLTTKESVISEMRHVMHRVGVCKGLLIYEFNMAEEEVDDLIRKYSEEAQEVASGDAEAALTLLMGDLKEMFGEKNEQSDD